MYEFEMKNQKWKIAENVKRQAINLGSIPSEEAEFHVFTNNQGTFVDCSIRNWITKLSKQPAFELTDYLVSPQGRILQVKGQLKNVNISFREKKKVVISPEERHRRSEHMKNLIKSMKKHK